MFLDASSGKNVHSMYIFTNCVPKRSTKRVLLGTKGTTDFTLYLLGSC